MMQSGGALVWYALGSGFDPYNLPKSESFIFLLKTSRCLKPQLHVSEQRK
jgi:hypothetical protein